MPSACCEINQVMANFLRTIFWFFFFALTNLKWRRESKFIFFFLKNENKTREKKTYLPIVENFPFEKSIAILLQNLKNENDNQMRTWINSHQSNERGGTKDNTMETPANKTIHFGGGVLDTQQSHKAELFAVWMCFCCFRFFCFENVQKVVRFGLNLKIITDKCAHFSSAKHFLRSFFFWVGDCKLLCFVFVLN